MIYHVHVCKESTSRRCYQSYQLIHKFNSFPIQSFISFAFDNLMLKFMWKSKSPTVVKTFWRERTRHKDLLTWYSGLLWNKTVWACNTVRPVEQWNRAEVPKTDGHVTCLYFIRCFFPCLLNKRVVCMTEMALKVSGLGKFLDKHFRVHKYQTLTSEKKH